jgi:hypothetical protein
MRKHRWGLTNIGTSKILWVAAIYPRYLVADEVRGPLFGQVLSQFGGKQFTIDVGGLVHYRGEKWIPTVGGVLGT